MKKLVVLFFALSLMLMVLGCGEKTEVEDTATETEETTTMQPDCVETAVDCVATTPVDCTVTPVVEDCTATK